jgi:CHAT domain-containing protein
MISLWGMPAFPLSLFSDRPSPPIASNIDPDERSASTLVNQGQSFYENQQFPAAIQAWQQALQVYETQGDRPQQAMTLTYLALAYQSLGDWTAAEDAIETSLDLLAGLAETPQRSQLLAQALNTKGQLEFTLGKTESALATWQQATAFYTQLGDTTGITGSLINQAQALEFSGFYRRSCQTLLQAVGIENDCKADRFHDIGPILQVFETQSDLQIRALGLRNLGNILRRMGYLVQSQQTLERSLQLSQNPLARSTTLLSLADTERSRYHYIRDLYDRTGLERDRRQALRFAQQAIDRYQQVSQQTTTDLLQIQAQLHRLDLLIHLQQWLQPGNSTAAQLPAQIQTQVTALFNGPIFHLPASRAAVDAKVNLAQSLMQTSTPEVAATETLINTALQTAQILQDPRAESYALGTLGHWYERLGYTQPQAWTEAQTYTASALGIAQAHQAWEIAYQWQWQLGRIYRAQKKRDAAVAYYNAAVETLENVRGNLVAIEADVQFSFRDTVEPVYRELVELELQTPPGTIPSQANLQQVIQKIDALQLSELENFLRCNLTPTIEISQTQIDPTAAVIYLILLDHQIAVVLRLPNSESLQFHTIPQSRETIDQTLDSLRQELEQRYLSRTGLALSQQVYDWLIRPIKPALEQAQVKTLTFVLDGTLRNVPMAALHDGQRYLIEDYAIALTPGLQLLDPKPLDHRGLNVLTFGLSEVRQDFPPHRDFAPLANVTTEVQEIRSQIPSEVVLNEGFTSRALQDLVRSEPAPIVHLATHGQFSSSPDDTFILSWDKRVTLDDLSVILQGRDRNTPNAIELLVLSACKTADGDSRAALGLAGVAVQSGARSTIASLWYVDDQATADLMADFYRTLVRTTPPISKAEALRQAQVRLLKTPGYRAPLYWAPYILVGNWL